MNASSVAQSALRKGNPLENPNALHAFHKAKRGPKGVPLSVVATDGEVVSNNAKDPGHCYARTSHISFQFFDQCKTNAPFGYEHFVSLPPAYHHDKQKLWPLILFLHGSGESQRNAEESYASLRHGIPKLILCYDRSIADTTNPSPCIDIPTAPHLRKVENKQIKEGDKSSEPVPVETCKILAENFITVCPSLNLKNGYGWNAPILDALLDEMVDRYRVDRNQIHLTGFSMGGYGVWDLALHKPDRFASISPMCGGAEIDQASQIKLIPHWIHHGALDDIIPAESSRQMYDALKAAGAVDVNLTEYPDLRHDCWTEAYNNRSLYEWMLQRSKPMPCRSVIDSLDRQLGFVST